MIENNFRIAAWNAQTSLSAEAERLPDAKRVIEGLNANILFIPEFAAVEDFRVNEDRHVEVMEELGYKSGEIILTQGMTRSQSAGLMSVWHNFDEEATIGSLKLGNRYCLYCEVPSGPIVVGVHLDSDSEESRMESVARLIEEFGEASPTIVTGDFNALEPGHPHAKLLRPLADLIRNITVNEYGDNPDWKWHRQQVQRVMLQAISDVIPTMEQAGFSIVPNNSGLDTVENTYIPEQLQVRRAALGLAARIGFLRQDFVERLPIPESIEFGSLLGKLGLTGTTIDHFMVNQTFSKSSGLVVGEAVVHSNRSARPNAPHRGYVSDHRPIATDVSFIGQEPLVQ